MDAPGESATKGCLEASLLHQQTTSLYDVIAELQASFPEDRDDLIVALVCHWLRRGQIRFLGDTVA